MSASTPNGQRVLIVDDNPSVVAVLRQALLDEGCRVDVAGDGLEALRRVADCPPDLILLDLDLPRLTGDAICRRLKNDPATSLIPIVMITGQGDFENKLAAWEYGADDFLPKPFHVVEVTLRCRSLLRIRRLIGERDSAETVVFALARTVEAKSPYTHGHSERVLRYALDLADALQVSVHDRKVLEKGALLHDIGKISVPDAILDKPGKLSREEFEIVKGHTAQGARIVEGLLSLREAVPLIRWHHERLDGKGYPDGLRGEQIPQLVRILSITDIYDSLASDRPYRPSIPHERCLEMLRDNARDGGLDPELVAVFTRIVTPLPTHPVSATACPSVPVDAARSSDVLPSPAALIPKR